MHDTTLPGISIVRRVECPDCQHEIPTAPCLLARAHMRQRDVIAKRFVDAVNAYPENPALLAAFSKAYDYAEPRGGHGPVCTYRGLPGVMLTLELTHSELQGHLGLLREIKRGAVKPPEAPQ